MLYQLKANKHIHSIVEQFKTIKSKENALKNKNIDCILYDYIYNCITLYDIKKKYHIGESLFKYILLKYTGLSVLPNKFYTTQNINNKNIDNILHDYVYRCKSIKYIEQKYKIDRRKIKRLFNIYNIEILPPSFFHAIKKRKNRIQKHNLSTLYNTGKSIKEISTITGKCQSDIIQTLHYYDIDIINKKTSLPEQEIKEYIESISNTTIIKGDRKTISPLEIDLYLPEHKLAIEYNGIFWHSEQQGKTQKYHLKKTEKCEEKGIQLIHIFENEWLNPIKQKIWKSVIANKLGIYQTKIGARQTKIRKVSNKDTSIFLRENHLQGNCKSSVKYGLYYKNKLISLMTFGKARFSKADWELIRFCSALNYQIYGAASKLLNHFKKYHNGSIISYANRRWSVGNLYTKLNFKFIHNSSPNYFYWKKGINILESRNKYQKHKLRYILKYFNEDLSEYQNMLNNGYDRIWDSGNKVYILNNIDK